jgi:hypothetical protein
MLFVRANGIFLFAEPQAASDRRSLSVYGARRKQSILLAGRSETCWAGGRDRSLLWGADVSDATALSEAVRGAGDQLRGLAYCVGSITLNLLARWKKTISSPTFLSMPSARRLPYRRLYPS